MDLIGERIIKKRKFFSFLISGLSTQIDITSSFITQIIFEKKLPFHFKLKINTETLYKTVCDYLSEQKYDDFLHLLIIKYIKVNNSYHEHIYRNITEK